MSLYGKLGFPSIIIPRDDDDGKVHCCSQLLVSIIIVVVIYEHGLREYTGNDDVYVNAPCRAKEV